jgi:hypothetical protein
LRLEDQPFEGLFWTIWSRLAITSAFRSVEETLGCESMWICPLWLS